MGRTEVSEHSSPLSGQANVVRLVPALCGRVAESSANANTQDDEETTVLHLASPRWREVARLLLEGGANTNARDKEGWLSCTWHHPWRIQKSVCLLLESGTNANAQFKNLGWTSLHLLSCSGNIEIGRMLFEGGANANAQDGNEWTSLHLATSFGKAEIMHLVLNHGADVNFRHKDLEGWTSLHLASSLGKRYRAAAARERGECR